MTFTELKTDVYEIAQAKFGQACICNQYGSVKNRIEY